MRKLTSILTIAFLAISVSLCAQTAKKGKTLVAYFSASGNTEAAAKKIQETAGADLYKIEPEKPYTKEDLDFRNRQARSVVEMGNPDFTQHHSFFLRVSGFQGQDDHSVRHFRQQSY